MSFAITIMGFVGGLCMSAIKRDSGIKDFGAIIEGHGGMLDRIDSLCFAAPIFPFNALLLYIIPFIFVLFVNQRAPKWCFSFVL